MILQKFLNQEKNRSKVYYFFIGVIFFVFVVQAVLFALNIKKGLPPDEGYHIALSEIYSKTFSIADNTEESYHLGQISNTPFLYHWLAGRVINVKDIFFPDSGNVVLLRLFSVFIGISNLVIALKVIRFITRDKLVHILFLIMLSNTLMFVFMSGSVSYDPLSIFFPSIIILYSLRLFKYHKVKFLYSIVIFMAFGSLTKITFLPFMLASSLVLILHESRYLKEYRKQFRNLAKILKRNIGLILLFILMFFSSALAVGFYGNNLIKYHSLKPSCSRVLPEEHCMKGAEFAHYYEAEKNALPRTERLRLLDYLSKWGGLMLDRTYGLCAHKSLLLDYNSFYSHLLILLFGFMASIRYFDKDKIEHVFFLCLIFVYFIVLSVLTNYKSYLLHGITDAAVQGRYLFPIIIPFYALMSLSMLSSKNKYIRLIVFAITSIVFIIGNIPFFLRGVTEEWFFLESTGISTVNLLKNFL